MSWLSSLRAAAAAFCTAADKQSAQNLKDARRPRMNFHELGVPTGSVLLFKDGPARRLPAATLAALEL